jgi:hypothetical protein
MGKFKTAKHYEQSQINLNMKKIPMALKHGVLSNGGSFLKEIIKLQ